jgi:hypothetical protein
VRRLAAIGLVVAARAAAADPPPLDHVVTAPTAWLPAAGAVVGEAALDQHGGGSLVVGYGLGGIAEVELGGDSDVKTCGDSPCSQALHQARAAFRIGARQDAWFDGQPAVVIGVQESLPGTRRVGEAYVVASRTAGPVRLHGGVVAFDAEDGGVRLGATVRPIGGIELVPPQYPKTTMMLDVAWLPEFDAAGPTPKWLGGFGVRYQALAWASIELAVRTSTLSDLGESAAMVRVNGVWSR